MTTSQLPSFERDVSVLVTGATSGIGLETVRQLADLGVLVWLGARDFGKGERLAREIGGSVAPVQIDVTDAQSIDAATQRIGPLDVLINNAGILPAGADDLPTTNLDQFRKAYETNVFGLLAVTQAFVPMLTCSDHPRIVNVSSGTSSLAWSAGPNPQFDWEHAQGGIAYRSSKTAVNALTVLFAQTLDDRFKVNALAPGLRRTNLVPGMAFGDDPAEAAAAVVRLALLPDDGPTGGFWSWDGSSVPW